MPEVRVEYKDGTKEIFPETHRTGGSYCTTCVCKDGWFIIEDAWGSQTIIPGSMVKRIEVGSSRRL